MVDHSRKIIFKHVTSLDLSYTKLGDLLKEIKDKIKMYGDEAYVDTYSYAYDQNTYHGGVYAPVPETDKEMTARISYEEASDKAREAQERKDFERLKEKFGK